MKCSKLSLLSQLLEEPPYTLSGELIPTTATSAYSFAACIKPPTNPSRLAVSAWPGTYGARHVRSLISESPPGQNVQVS